LENGSAIYYLSKKPHLAGGASKTYVYGMRTLLVAVALLATSPALAGECYFTNYSNQRIVLDSEHLTIHGLNGEIERCGLATYPDQPRLTTAVCESGWQADYVLGSSTIDGTEQDIMSFAGVMWYRRCHEPA